MLVQSLSKSCWDLNLWITKKVLNWNPNLNQINTLDHIKSSDKQNCPLFPFFQYFNRKKKKEKRKKSDKQNCQKEDMRIYINGCLS
jgi:hypothetical protein